MKLSHTRAMVRAALAGKLDERRRPTTIRCSALRFRQRSEGVPADVLDARITWKDPRRTTRRRAKLAGMFRDNIKKFADGVRESERNAAAERVRLTAGVTFVRDPLWNNIRVDPTAERLLDTRVVQRLRYVRQLGLAHPRLSRRDALAVRTRTRRVPSRAPHARAAARTRATLARTRRRRGAIVARGRAAARRRTLSVFARARGDRRAAPRGRRAAAHHRRRDRVDSARATIGDTHRERIVRAHLAARARARSRD